MKDLLFSPIQGDVGGIQVNNVTEIKKTNSFNFTINGLGVTFPFSIEVIRIIKKDGRKISFEDLVIDYGETINL